MRRVSAGTFSGHKTGEKRAAKNMGGAETLELGLPEVEAFPS
jgi:hypothetical protein